MIVLQILIGLFFAVGIGYILADLLKVPSMKATKAASNLGRKGDKKTSTIEIYLKEFSLKLAEKLKMNEYKRAQLEADLKTAGMDMTPEQYTANAIVKVTGNFVGLLPHVLCQIVEALPSAANAASLPGCALLATTLLIATWASWAERPQATIKHKRRFTNRFILITY